MIIDDGIYRGISSQSSFDKNSDREYYDHYYVCSQDTATIAMILKSKDKGKQNMTYDDAHSRQAFCFPCPQCSINWFS